MHASALARTGLVLLFTATLAACQPPGTAATGGTGGPPKKDRGSLRGRADGVRFDDTGGAKHKVVYEGGPKESWAIAGRSQLPPELEAKPGYEHLDDHDVELLEPVAGAPKVELAVPDFCDDYSGAGLDLSFGDAHVGLPRSNDTMLTIHILRSVAWAACDRMHYEPRQKVVQRLLQTHVNQTKTPIAELEKLLASLAASPIEETFCGSDPMTRWLLCGERPKDEQMPRIERLDMMEMRAQPLDEERFRLGMVSFVHAKREQLVPVLVRPRSGRAPGGWTVDIQPGGEMFHNKGMSTADRWKETVARASVHAVEVQGIGWEALAMTLLAREKNTVTRYLLEKRFLEWRAAMEKGAAAVGDDLQKAKALEDEWRKNVLDVDAAGIRAAFEAIENPSASEACAKVEVATAAAVKRKAPADWKAAVALLTDPAIDLLLQARQKCHSTEARTKLAKIEKELLRRFSRRSWGPRLNAYRTLHEWPNLGLDFDAPATFTVRSVKAKGEKVEISFEPDVWEETRETCVETNIVDRITWEGKVEYRFDCKDLPPIRHTEPLPPIALPKAAAEGVKKGHVLVIADDAGNPTVVYGFSSKKDSAALTNFLGAPLSK